MAQSFFHFQGDLTVKSSPTEVRAWVEGLDYSFLAYGESFERAEINGERLLNITRKILNELGIIHTDHQDILLKAVTSICKKNKVEEQAMQEDQNDKTMSTRVGKQSEHLEHAIDRVLVMISERRRARSLHGTSEQPPHNILTAALELVNMVKMMLNSLERPPFDCMSELSSLKSHLIKHISLLKHFSEQPDLSHEMESDMIDVCKGVTKICQYIVALPPDLQGPETQTPGFTSPEERPPRVQVPIMTKPDSMSFPMEHGLDFMTPIQHPSMPVTTSATSGGRVSPFKYMSLPHQRIPDISECFSPKRRNTPSNEGTVLVQSGKGNKYETEVSHTKDSETSGDSLDYKSPQDLTVIKSDNPLMDSGSEGCVIDSDSDKGIGSEYDLEQHSRDSGSVIWGMDSDSERCPRASDSTRQLLEKDNYQMDSGSVKDPTESEQHLVRVKWCHMDSDSLKQWMDSGSEKCFEDSDSEKYLIDSDNGRLGIDSDSDKCPMTSSSVKHMSKVEKRQMASDSVRRLMESKERLMETEKLWMISASERYVMDSDSERGRVDSASASRVHLMGEEKHQEKSKSKRYMMDSDSEPCEMDSDSERYELASTAVKCLMDMKRVQLSTGTEGLWLDSWSERQTVYSDSERIVTASDSMKHLRKAETCQSASDLEGFWMGLNPESERCWRDSERQKLDFNYGRHSDRSRIYQYRSVRLEDSSESCQDDLLKYQDNFERDQVDSNSEKYHTNSEKEIPQNQSESIRHLTEMEGEQCLIQFENERFQNDGERESHLIKSESEKGHKNEFDNERYRLDSQNEAHRLGARRKDNRPQGFWRPILLPLPLGQGKKNEEQHAIEQTDNKVSRIQLMRYLSDDKTMRFKEVSPPFSDKQASQQKLKEKHSHKPSPDPSTFMDDKHHGKASRKISVCKSHCKDYRYAQSFESSESEINPIHLSAESYTSDMSAPVCSPTSISPMCVVRRKTQSNSTHSLDMGAQRCYKCFMEINNSPFHKCLLNSDDDSDPDCPLHLQIPLDSKYSLSSKSFRHHKTSRNSPLSRSLDPKHPVGIHCALHQEYSDCFFSSASYLHCESCSALQNLRDTTITHTFPVNFRNIMGQYNNSGSCDAIDTSNITVQESEGKLNLTAIPKNEGNPGVSAGNFKDKVNAKDKHLSKDETDHEDETNSDDTDAEEETDTEDEANNKNKKDPKDKSDPDDTDPKGSNSENDTDTNNGSDPSGDAGPTGGADSNNDGDPKNGTDRNSRSDSNIDNDNNNDVKSKYSTNTEEDKYTNSDNASGLADGVDQNNTRDSTNGTNPEYTSGSQNRTVLDYTSGPNNDDGPNNVTGPGDDICPNIGSNLQNIRSIPKSLRPNNSPRAQSNSPLKNPDSNYNAKPSNNTSHNSAVSPKNDADPDYGTRPASDPDHNYTTAQNYNSDLNYVLEFVHVVWYSFVINPNSIDRNSYVARLSSAAKTINVTDTSNTTNCSSAISPRYPDGINYALDTSHIPRFTHFIGSNITINPNYNVINTCNANPSNSTSASNITNHLFDPKLENSSSSSILNIVYGNISNFAAGTKYTSTPDYLTTSKFCDPPKFGRNYVNFDNQKFGDYFKDSAGSIDSARSKHATGSKDVLDVEESDFLKDFSMVQNPIGISDLVSLKIHANLNTPLPSFNIVEEEPPDVVKFAISSGAWKKVFKLIDNHNSAMRAHRGPMGEATRKYPEGVVWESAEGIAWGPEGGLSVRSQAVHAVSPTVGNAERLARGRTMSPVNPARGPAMSPASGRSVRPGRGRTVNPARGRSVSPSRGRDVSPARRHAERLGRGRAVSVAGGYVERQERQHTVSPSRRPAGNPAQGLALGPALKRLCMKYEGEIVLGAAVELTVKPAEGYDAEVSRSAKQPTQSTSDRNENENENESSILTDTKVDGFIYLPEFRIDLAPHCRRHHAFQATHARIKDFYFAATCSDEMNYWVGQMLRLAYGSSFGDATANAEYRRLSAMIYANCVLALKRDFPVIWCNNCQEATTIVSVDPNFQYRRSQSISDKFLYFRPLDAEIREKTKRQKQQKPNMSSHQYNQEGIHQRDLGNISQMAMATTPPLTKELESVALIRPKTSGLLRLEIMPVKAPGAPESQRLDVTGIVSPEEKGKGTAILVAGVPGKEELDDAEIPTLKFTGLMHLEALINKCSPSSEYSRPGTPGNLWMESPENAESPGSDDMEVARSMYPFRERSTFRRSWAELLEAPLNSEGLHILQTTPTEEERETSYFQLVSEEENQVATPLRDHPLLALQGPFPLPPQSPKLQRERSYSLPRYSDGRSQKLNAPEFTLNPEETVFFPTDHNLPTGENTKKRNTEESWQRAILSHPEEYPAINPSFENSTMQGKAGIPEDNAGLPRSNVRISRNNVSSIPMVNVRLPIDNPEVLRGNGGVPMGSARLPRDNSGVPRGSAFRVPMSNVENLGQNVGTSRRIVSSPLTELLKIGEHEV